MKVRYSYLPQQFAEPDAILAEIKAQLLKDCDFTLGKAVEKFEASFAKLIGTKHAVGVNSGTDALMIPLKALGIGHGDEVITAANTFIATVGAINAVGAYPRLVDVTPYFTIDPAKIEAAITPKTKAIMPVHFTGEPCDMDPILDLARRKGLPIVEDACQSIQAEFDGRRCGTMGVAAGFSLHPLKNLNVWGDAGVVVTNDDYVAKKLRHLRNHGMDGRDTIVMFGYNSRLDTLQAIVGNWLIGQTNDITKKRIENAARYDRAFSEIPQITLPPRRKNVKRVFHLYMVYLKDLDAREALRKHCLAAGIEVKVHYPTPLHLQPALREIGYFQGQFPESERQSDRILTFPTDQHLSNEQIDYAIQTVRDFFKKG
jgi:aminotransferase EvaB